MCESCGKRIENNNGMLEWYSTIEIKNGKIVAEGFRIVHNTEECGYGFQTLYEDKKSLSDRHLSYFENMSPLEVMNDIKETYYIDNENIILDLFK